LSLPEGVVEYYLHDTYFVFSPRQLFGSSAFVLLVLALGYLLLPQLTRTRAGRVLSAAHIALTLAALTALVVILAGRVTSPPRRFNPSDYNAGHDQAVAINRILAAMIGAVASQLIFIVNVVLGIARSPKAV
jgi:heme/copper-type cytochrome/quinol oxidase subunit 1